MAGRKGNPLAGCVGLIAMCGFAGSVCGRHDPITEPPTGAIEAQAISAATPAPSYVAPAPAPTYTPPARTYDPWEGRTSEPAPSYREPDAAPSGASAQCVDGTYSYSANRRGTCSHHGGVARWL